MEWRLLDRHRRDEIVRTRRYKKGENKDIWGWLGCIQWIEISGSGRR